MSAGGCSTRRCPTAGITSTTSGSVRRSPTTCSTGSGWATSRALLVDSRWYKTLQHRQPIDGRLGAGLHLLPRRPLTFSRRFLAPSRLVSRHVLANAPQIGPSRGRFPARAGRRSPTESSQTTTESGLVAFDRPAERGQCGGDDPLPVEDEQREGDAGVDGRDQIAAVEARDEELDREQPEEGVRRPRGNRSRSRIATPSRVWVAVSSTSSTCRASSTSDGRAAAEQVGDRQAADQQRPLVDLGADQHARAPSPPCRGRRTAAPR